MYINLDTAKKHLNVDETYTGDDTLIEEYIEVAEKVVSMDICEELDTLAAGEGETKILPAPLRQAILLLVGHYYANREPVAFANSTEVPLSYRHLIQLYRNYSK